MFTIFRENVKLMLDTNKLTYSQLSVKSGVAESTIKCFMCGANDSRRTAERIADALDCNLIYSNGVYSLSKKVSDIIGTTVENLVNGTDDKV